jgi:hypothetical protein
MSCFLQADLNVFALRWSGEHFVSLHVVQDVQRGKKLSSRRASGSEMMSRRRSVTLDGIAHVARRMSMASSSTNSAGAALHVLYSDCGGVSRKIVLHMSDSKATKWISGLKKLLLVYPRALAQWRTVDGHYPACLQPASRAQGRCPVLSSDPS